MLKLLTKSKATKSLTLKEKSLTLKEQVYSDASTHMKKIGQEREFEKITNAFFRDSTEQAKKSIYMLCFWSTNKLETLIKMSQLWDVYFPEKLEADVYFDRIFYNSTEARAFLTHANWVSQGNESQDSFICFMTNYGGYSNIDDLQKYYQLNCPQ